MAILYKTLVDRDTRVCNCYLEHDHHLDDICKYLPSFRLILLEHAAELDRAQHARGCHETYHSRILAALGELPAPSRP